MSSAESRNPFTRRGFIIAAIGVGVIILAAIIVLIATLTRTPDPAPTPTAPGTPTPTETTDPADASVCGLPGFDEESSLTSAPDTEWELVGTVAAPTDPDGAGPGVIDDDGFRSCYAHTAQGALYAIANYAAIGTDATLRPRLPELVAPSAGQEALRAGLEGDSSGSTSQYRAQFAGFKVGQYDGQNATIEVVLNYSDGRLVAAPFKPRSTGRAEGGRRILI